jgi:hypothetical protein
VVSPSGGGSKRTVGSVTSILASTSGKRTAKLTSISVSLPTSITIRLELTSRSALPMSETRSRP